MLRLQHHSEAYHLETVRTGGEGSQACVQPLVVVVVVVDDAGLTFE
jgi:hypothetical protein